MRAYGLEKMLACGEGEEERTAKEKVDGGDTGGHGDGPGGAEISGEETERMEDADYDSR